MAIKYPGEQKIGYGKAQIFDTSKLAEGAWKAGEKLSLKRKEKKKAKDEFVKNLKDIDVSKIRQVDTDYITGNVNAVSEYFYKNSAAILNPKLDGGKAAIEVERLKAFAVGEVQKSIGIKEEDKMLNDRIISDKDHFGTHENYSLHNTRIRTAMNHPMWNDHETPVTEVQVDLSMTEEEKTDFYSKSKTEQDKILKGKIPMQVALNDYNSLETVEEKQAWLVNNNYDLGDSGDNDDGVDGDWGTLSQDAEKEFLDKANKSIEERSSGIIDAGNISNYETFEEYKNIASPNYQEHLSENEFNNIKNEYNEYETTWNESQGTFETKTEGGNTVVGLHNRQLNANPMLGEHIQKVAKDIQFSEAEITRIATERVGEGNVNIFETKKQVATEHIVNTIMGSIKGHRFNPEMMKELNTELSERQKQDENFTLEDLVLEKAQGYIKNENKFDFVRDIFKPRGTSFSVGGTPPIQHVGMPLDPNTYSMGVPNSSSANDILPFTTQAQGVSVQITESTTGKSTYALTTTSSGWRRVSGAKNKKGVFVPPSFESSRHTFSTFRPTKVETYFTATSTFTHGSKTYVKGDIVPDAAQEYSPGDCKKAQWLMGFTGDEEMMVRLDVTSKADLAQWMLTRTKNLDAVKEAFRKGGISFDFSKIAGI